MNSVLILFFFLFFFSVLVHSGGVHGGHYYAYIRPTLSDQWYAVCCAIIHFSPAFIIGCFYRMHPFLVFSRFVAQPKEDLTCSGASNLLYSFSIYFIRILQNML